MTNIKEILNAKDKFKISLGLERVERALEIFNHPELGRNYIHVAGTNGKGSVCAILEQILLEEGKKTIGKYTSPHLFSYNERFSVNGNPVDDLELQNLIELINSKDKEYSIGLTEFEILTVVCFLFFKNHNVEIGIMETGLGGRLDATNVIKKPLISVITSVSYDHKERLGDTIEKIAFEKAGILKEGCAAVFLKENAGYKTLKMQAEAIGANIIPEKYKIEIEDNTAIINGEKCPFSLNGDFQKENLTLALTAIDVLCPNISKEIIKRALKKVKWKFRMQKASYKNKDLLIDGAHNPDGARVLSEYLKKYQKNKKIRFIFGCLKNKEHKLILDELYNDEFDFCFYQFNYPNALKYDDLDIKYKSKLRNITSPLEEIEKGGFDLCVIAGSLYMLGKIFKNVKLNSY